MDLARTLRLPDGATLAYWLWRPGGNRPLLVLVHGLASNHTRWAEFTATSRLRESWDLLRVDLRGFGASLSRGPVGLDRWCRDLAAILAAEGRSRAVLAGHCLGANVVLRFAACHPAATRGLVLVEPMFPQALTGPLARAARLRPMAGAAAALLRRLNALGLHRRRLPALDLEALDREARAAMAARGPEAFPEARFGSTREDLRFTPTAVYLSGLVAVTEPAPDLASIRAPVLALLSRGGRFGDPEITRRLLAALPRHEIRLLEARHWIPTEAPAAMRDAIDDWCARLPEEPEA